MGEISEMPYMELRAWRAYYSRYPFDDLRRYHRGHAATAHLLASTSGVKGSRSEQYMPWQLPSGDPDAPPAWTVNPATKE